MKFRYLLFFSVMGIFGFISIVGAATTVVKPKTLAPGTVFKFKEGKVVYFVASDATAYPFPDEQTFFSWYPSFSKVKVHDKKTVANPLSKLPVTLKPGARIVKFGSDPKVYAVSKGARLRWITDEKILVELYGQNWRNYFEQLSNERIREYSLAEKITNAKNYNRNEERSYATISSELNQRKILKKETIAPDGSVYPLLKSLGENVSASFSPAFKPKIFYYTIKTSYVEDRITLTPVAYDSFMTVKVKDYAIDEANKNVTIDVPAGESDVPIYVSTPDGRTNTYIVHVSRKAPSDDVKLKSLTENLSDTIWPKFKPQLANYTLKAKETENSITVKAVPNYPKARVIIDGKETTEGSGYTKALVKGLNKIEIQVIAENGASTKYLVEISKPI